MSLRGRYDNFDSIRFRARQKVENGELTQEEASAWVREQDAAEYASVTVAPLEPRTSGIPEDRTLSNGWRKDGRTGTVREPEYTPQTKWGENV